MRKIFSLLLLLTAFLGFSQEDNTIISAGKSPSLECEKRTYNRAQLNGGVTQDFSVNVENIREISRKLNYNILSDATFVYVPSSYGEGKNFAQVQNKRNLLLNSTTGTTQNVTTTAQQYTLQLKGTGTYTLSGTFSGSLVGTGASNLVTLTFTPTAGTLTLTVSGSITEAQLETGSFATPYQKTVASGDGIVDFNFTRATSATVTNKLGVIEDSCYNRLSNSATGSTQTITVAAGTYDLSFFGTGNYVLSGAATGTKTGTGATDRVSFSVVCTTGSLTLTSSGTITNTQFSLGSQRPYIRTTNRLNVPKLDYSRGIGEPELLIERQSTNLFLQSEDLTTANWSKVNSTATLNTTINPLNINKSYYLTDNTTNAVHQVYQSAVATTSGLPYSVSYYVKKADDTWCQFAFETSAFSAWVNFNFDTGLFGNGIGGTWSAKIIANDYWLVTGTAIATVTGILKSPASVLGTNNTNSSIIGLSYIGTNRKFCNVAGIQVEQGSNATTYIPTTTATVTRNAETSYVDLFNNAALNSANFTLFWEGYLYDGQTTNMSVCLSDSTTAATNTNQIGWYSTMTPFYNISNTRTNKTAATNGLHRFAIEYNNGTADFWLDGVETSSGNSVPVFDYRYLVLNNGGSTYATDKIALFNRTLSNGELTTLTAP